jgi:hypothetical protein
MRKLVKVAVTTVALILSQACYIYPVETIEIVDRRTEDNYTDTVDDWNCTPLPREADVISCSDYYEAAWGEPREYAGTCCEVYYYFSDSCAYGHYETWCQWADSCDWEEQGFFQCEVY